ncbi:MAG: chemotaxis protein CheW [bacterium]|nr:chemotaxis protein CheW [bacterium]
MTFILDGGEYAVNVSDVFGIYRDLPVVPDPDGPRCLDGVVQFRDFQIPVVNLRRFVGLGEGESRRSGRWIVIVNDGSCPVGLVVDRVTEVVQLSPQSVKPVADDHRGLVGGYVTAAARLGGRDLFFPDLNRLIHDAISQ